ncbi:hypothetical protein PMAYCL1PPCAC_02659, partial [Pristionchus mayeri]
MRLFLLSFFFSFVISVRLSLPSPSLTLDSLLRDARCESFCFVQCYKIHFENLITSFCDSCKSKCDEARTTASRKKINAFLTPILRVSDREKGQIELDLTLSSTCQQCLVVLEYRFVSPSGFPSRSDSFSFHIVTPGVYSFSDLPLDSAYQFRTHLIHLWQSKKTSLTQWADLTPD